MNQRAGRLSEALASGCIAIGVNADGARGGDDQTSRVDLHGVVGSDHDVARGRLDRSRDDDFLRRIERQHAGCRLNRRRDRQRHVTVGVPGLSRSAVEVASGSQRYRATADGRDHPAVHRQVIPREE